MFDLAFAKSSDALLKGADHLLVIAPEATFGARRFPKGVLPDDLRNLAVDLAKDTAAGLMGRTATTLAESVRRLTIGVLPNKVSRYNAPCRAEATRKAVLEAGLSAGTSAILVIVDSESHALGAANAAARCLPMADLHSGAKLKKARILVAHRTKGVLAWSRDARETLIAARDAARLVDEPPTDLNPTEFVKQTRSLLRGVDGITIREIKGDRLLDEKLGGIHAVGRTALQPPRLLIATYSPAKPTGPHIALVGKGITYDTGGLHLKARGSMESMKCDMGGAAAVLGAFKALTKSKAKQKVSLLLCLAENAIGPAAYKPDDVIHLHSGKTVEINNTDAEGRVVLADGVSYAARKLKAEVIIDAATLTGAQMIATGEAHSAVMSNDASLEKTAVDAGRESGDLAHPLPFAPEFYRKEFHSPIADMKNSVKNRANAQSSCAGEFIHWQIADTEAKWCHFDMAGPAFRGGRGTGYGVALLKTLAERLS